MLKLLVPLLVGAACQAAPADFPPAIGQPRQFVSDFLYAIRQVESGDRYDGPVGPRGELGAYQFRRQVWFQHTRAPFSQARTTYADAVAEKHFRWIAETLRSAGLAATAWNFAAAWNCGVDNVLVGRIPRKTRDYASRVQNIVEEEVSLRRSLAPHFPIAASGAVAAAIGR